MNTLNNIIPSPLLINLTLNSNYATSKYATSDFNGKENTNMINENLNSEMYVAGLGELGIIMENISYINNIIKEHNGDIISYNAKYASSTFYYEKDVFNNNYDIFNNINNVWIYDTYNGKISYENISNNLKMLSLYKYNVKDFDSTEDDYDDISVNYLNINNENKDKFDISSYLFYSQDDLLDNLENTLTYNFFEDTLNEENKGNYSSFQFNEVFSIEHVDQKILKNDYNYFTTINTLQFINKISDLHYKISENNIDNYYKVDVINNLYDGSSGEVITRKYTEDSNFYTLDEYKTNTYTNLNGYVVVDSISYKKIYTTKFYKYSEGESTTDSVKTNNIINSNIISDNESIIVDSIDSLKYRIKTILGKYKIIYDNGTEDNPYVKLNDAHLEYYAYYEGNDQQFYISPTLDDNFYINYNLSSNNEIKIKINFNGFIDTNKNYYNSLSIIVKFNVTYISDKNSVILNLKKDNTEIFGNVILYGDIYENNNHIKDFIYTLIVTVPKDKNLGENFEVTVSSGLKNDPNASKYFDLNLDQINNIDKKTDDGTLKIKNFIKQTNTNSNYDFYEATFKISLINSIDNDQNSDFISYSGNNLYLKLYFAGNNQYNGVENSIFVKILNCKRPNTNNNIYFYINSENIANTPEEITQPYLMNYSTEEINKIYLYVGEQFEQNEYSNIYYSSNNTTCLKVSNTSTNKLQFNQQIIKGQKNGEVTITAEIKGNLYQRRKAELKINYVYFDQTLSLEFNDDNINVDIDNNEYVYRISGTHNRINEDVVKDKNNINRQCKYFEIDLPTPNVKLNNTNVTLQSNEINSLIDSLKFSLVGDKTNDSTIITIDGVEQNIESNVAFYKLNTNKKIQICVTLDKDLNADDNNVEIILYLKVICPENNNVKIRCPQTISYLKIVLYGDFKLNINNENELLMGMRTSSLRNNFVPNTHSLSYIEYIDSDDFDNFNINDVNNYTDDIYGVEDNDFNNSILFGAIGDGGINTGDYSDGESSSGEGGSTNNFTNGNYYKTINVNFDYSYYVCFVKDDLSSYLIDTNNTYIINHKPKNKIENVPDPNNQDHMLQNETFDQYEYTIMTSSGSKNIIVNSYYINIGHQQNNDIKYYKQISNKNIKIQYLDKTNIVEYPIYDSIVNDSIKIYSMPLLPSKKIDNYFDCEFYIVIPKLIKNDGKKYSIDQIYNNIKINIKFGDGEIKKTLSAYRRLNDCVIYKYQGVDLYDSNHIQNQEIIITILDLSEKNSIENQIVYSQKIFFNLFELKVEQGKYQNIDMQLRYSNYYPLKYPLKDTKKRYIELTYIPYDNISKYSIDTLKDIKTNSNNIYNNFNYNYDELSFNYSYMNSNITHKIEQMNLLEWFLKENGNGLMVDKFNTTDYLNPNYNMFSTYISCIDSKQYDIEKFGIYFRRYVNYDEFGIINALDKNKLSNIVNILNISDFNNINNEKKIDFKLYGLKNIIYLIYSNIFNFNFNDVEYDQSVSDYVDVYNNDDNNVIEKLSIFDDYLFIYNNTGDEIEFYFTDESHTLCQSTRRVSIKSKKLICYKPSRHDNYNIVIKNCKLENYEITLNKLYLNTDNQGNLVNQINLVSNIKHLLNIVNETEQFSFNINYNENTNVDKHFLTNATIKNNDNSDIIIIPIYNYTICKFGNLVVFNKL